MAALTGDDVERVRDLIASVPSGRLVTYGDVAAAAGLTNARIVAMILRTDGGGIPWHRVVPASGKVAPAVAQRQLEALRAEGVLADGDRIPLARLRFPLD